MNRVAGIFFALMFLAYGYLATDIQLDFWAEEETFNARTFPYLIAIGGCLVSIVLAAAPPRTQSIDINLNNPGAAGLILLMLAYSLLLEPMGFPLATAAFLAGALLLLGEKRWWLVGSISLGLTLSIWLIMSGLGIYLDPGVLRL